MKKLLVASLLLTSLPAYAQAIDPDDIPFYCREGSSAHWPCYENGDMERYHKRSSPYYRPDTGPVYWDRYGYRHRGHGDD